MKGVILIFPNIVDKKTNKKPLVITSNGIRENTLVIKKKATSGTWITPGSAIASECSYTLTNEYADYDFSLQWCQVFVCDVNTPYYNYGNLNIEFFTDDNIPTSLEDGKYYIYCSENRICNVGGTNRLTSEIITNDTPPSGYNYQGKFRVDTVSPHLAGQDVEISSLDMLAWLNVSFKPVTTSIFNQVSIGENHPFSIAIGVTYDGGYNIDTFKKTLIAYTTLKFNLTPSVLEMAGLPKGLYFDMLSICKALYDVNVNDYKSIITELNTSYLSIYQYYAQICGAVVIYEALAESVCFLRFNNYDSGYDLTKANSKDFRLQSNKTVGYAGWQYTNPKGKTYYKAASQDTETEDDGSFSNGAGLVFDVSNNPLFDNLIRPKSSSSYIHQMMRRVNSTYKNFTFMPFESYVLNAPYLKLGDGITYTDDDGVEYIAPITEIQYVPNGFTYIACNGDDISKTGKNVTTSPTCTTAEAYNIVSKREPILLGEALSLSQGNTETINNVSQYNVFIITIKYGSSNPYYGDILCCRGTYGEHSITDNTIFGNRVRYSNEGTRIDTSILQVRLTTTGDTVKVEQCIRSDVTTSYTWENATVVRIRAIS